MKKARSLDIQLQQRKESPKYHFFLFLGDDCNGSLIDLYFKDSGYWK